MKERVLARRYAKALLDLGVEEKALERLREETDRLSEAFAMEPNCLKFLSLREFSFQKKEALLASLTQKLLLSPWMGSFLKLLLKGSRIALFPVIAEVFEELVRQSENKVVAFVQTAERKTIENLKEMLRRSLEKTTGKKVDFKIEEDPALIGGLRVCIGDTIYDASLAGELDRIREKWI